MMQTINLFEKLLINIGAETKVQLKEHYRIGLAKKLLAV